MTYGAAMMYVIGGSFVIGMWFMLLPGAQEERIQFGILGVVGIVSIIAAKQLIGVTIARNIVAAFLLVAAGLMLSKIGSDSYRLHNGDVTLLVLDLIFDGIAMASIYSIIHGVEMLTIMRKVIVQR
jgi:hypothetical protein